jgi:hypothetical protein
MMNHLKLVLITFSVTMTMLAYQNCQKMGSSAGQASNSLSVESSVAAIELNFAMSGMFACMDRCLAGTKISADLSTGTLNIDNYISDNTAMVAAAVAPSTSNIGTKFTIQLTKEQLDSLIAVLESLELERRYVEKCVPGGPCSYRADNSYLTHYFKYSNGETHKVFTATGIDPNLRGEQFWVMGNAAPLACTLKAIIESTALRAEEKADSISGLTTALSFYEGYNTLVCNN